MFKSKVRVIVSVAAAAIVGSTFSAASAAQEGSPELVVKRAMELFHDGKEEESLKLQKELLDKQPNCWLAHATLAYMQWRRSNIVAALSEAERAASLASDNNLVLINLGLMQQAVRDYPAAIASFSKARKLDPDNPIPLVGIARCYIMSEKTAKALKILNHMSECENGSFNWFYYSGNTCLKINELDLALKLLSKARHLASTSAEETEVDRALLLCRLRKNQFDESNSLYERVIDTCDHHETIVRCADTLLSASHPERGKDLLNRVSKNLEKNSDARTFFQLGRIYECNSEKADTPSIKSAWLDSSLAAFEFAVALAPKEAGYHQAYANALISKRLNSLAIAELKKAQEIHGGDPLPGFILKYVFDKDNLSNTSMDDLKLQKAHFVIEGLDCKCRLSKLQGTMRAMEGVSFVTTNNKKVPEGEVVFYPSISSAAELFTKTECAYIQDLKKRLSKPLPQLSLKLLSQEPVNVHTVFQLSSAARYGSVQFFQESMPERFNRFNDIQPSTPLQIMSSSKPPSSAEKATSDSAPPMVAF
ncbi:MAG: tetratricopeptide repeat protein [Candidatus Obscuribacterales bacterium]|nr:tetratricopeptide repeat protein [Candidatus Obscuribacterales bacterium]